MTESALTPNPNMACPAHMLDKGEMAIWWDKPNPRHFALREIGTVIMIGGFIVIAGLTVLFEKNDSNSFRFNAGIGVIVFGLIVLVNPVYLYLKAETISYLIVRDHVVIDDSGGLIRKHVSNLGLIEVCPGSGGFSDVLFMDTEKNVGDGGTTIIRDGFIGIANAEAVAREMRRLQAAAA